MDGNGTICTTISADVSLFPYSMIAHSRATDSYGARFAFVNPVWISKIFLSSHYDTSLHLKPSIHAPTSGPARRGFLSQSDTCSRLLSNTFTFKRDVDAATESSLSLFA
jgi:hypothetical protein